jgi:hypothetical protein
VYDRDALVLLRHDLDLGMAKTAIASQFGLHPRTIHHWIATGQWYRELDDPAPRRPSTDGLASSNLDPSARSLCDEKWTSFGGPGRRLEQPVWDYSRDSTRRYPGNAVLLIGPRDQSHVEYLAYWLQHANGTALVGTPTSGTLGASTSLVVPGGVRLAFTNGGGPDRRGLQPDVPAARTIAGVRAQRDEALDAAVAYLKRRLR